MRSFLTKLKAFLSKHGEKVFMGTLMAVQIPCAYVLTTIEMRCTDPIHNEPKRCRGVGYEQLPPHSHGHGFWDGRMQLEDSIVHLIPTGQPRR